MIVRTLTFFSRLWRVRRTNWEKPFIVDRHPRDGGHLVNYADHRWHSREMHRAITRLLHASVIKRLERFDESSRIILSRNRSLRSISLARYHTRVIIYIVGRMRAIDIVNQGGSISPSRAIEFDNVLLMLKARSYVTGVSLTTRDRSHYSKGSN